MISPQKIADIMGLSCKIESLHELNELILQGVPKECLTHTVNHLSFEPSMKKNIKNRLIPSATYKRRKTVLNTQEGERIARIARIYAEALDVWGNQNDAQHFLLTPHTLLDNQTPLDTAFTSLGALLVEQVLNEMRYGLPV